MPNPRNLKGTSLYGIRRSLVSHSLKGSRPRPPKEYDESSGLFDQFPPERALKHFEQTAKSVLKAFEPPKHPKVTEALSAFDKPLGRGFKRFEFKVEAFTKGKPSGESFGTTLTQALEPSFTEAKGTDEFTGAGERAMEVVAAGEIAEVKVVGMSLVMGDPWDVLKAMEGAIFEEIHDIVKADLEEEARRPPSGSTST